MSAPAWAAPGRPNDSKVCGRAVSSPRRRPHPSSLRWRTAIVFCAPSMFRRKRGGDMAAKKPRSEVRPTDLTLRSYKVGFGDCFLLTFHYPNFDRNLLVDFGTMRVPEEKNESAHMLAIAKRSEERRVGKEGVSTCRARWARDQKK